MGNVYEVPTWPEPSMAFVELTADRKITYWDNQCEDGYGSDEREVIEYNEFEIVYADSSEAHWTIEDGVLTIEEPDGTSQYMKPWMLRFPPQYWTSPHLMNDEYEPDDHPSEATSIIVGADPQEHTFGCDNGADYFIFSAVLGEAYTLETNTPTNPSVDIRLDVMDLSTSRVAEADSGGVNLNPKLVWSSPDNADYYVRIRASGESRSGAYTFSIN